MGLEELGGVIIAQATQRVELASQNITNTMTAGYKARRQFLPLVELSQDAAAAPQASQPVAQISADFTAGKLQNTNNPFDLAISGDGFFVIQSAGRTLYTRGGQFHRGNDGRPLTPDGGVLQSLSGDVVVDGNDFTVLADGTIQQAGQPITQIAVADFDDKRALEVAGTGLFAAPPGTARDVAAPQIRQGMIETSNVSSSDEMTAMMAALRSAETGQRVIQVYDDLMGRALNTFGQM